MLLSFLITLLTWAIPQTAGRKLISEFLSKYKVGRCQLLALSFFILIIVFFKFQKFYLTFKIALTFLRSLLSDIFFQVLEISLNEISIFFQ